MSDAFDPFSLEDDDDDYEGEHSHQQYEEQQPHRPTNRNVIQPPEESVMFDHNDNVFRQNDVIPKGHHHGNILTHVPVTNLNTSVDSDIYSHLFASPPAKITSPAFHNTSISDSSDVSNSNSNSGSSRNEVFSKSSMENMIPINIILLEQMSVTYDSVPNSSPVMEMKGTINIKPSTIIGGHTFYISLKDTERHLKQITSFFDITKEVTDHSKEEDPFVKKHQEQGDRIFKVSMPTNIDCLGTKPVNVIKYIGSEYLRPIPLLVNVKVRVAGDVCRVGVKIRSNPIHTHNLDNLVVLIAIPPDVSGESAKMSRQGGVWDPIKRVIVYKYDVIQSGETVDLQMQFDYVPSIRKDGQNAMLPRFPVLVRCISKNESLSNVQLDVGGEGDGSLSRSGISGGGGMFQMHLDKSFQLFHRKI
mmetsp:Transcript_7770/g.14649  ORF Transcript_7770/g.14649 Transcript_7770/m.14649 type:complete len:417 (+) Transcript_7770:174-1424(+)